MLQSDIDSIETWSAEHLLQLNPVNPVKCKHMLISKRRHLTTGHFTLFLNGNELEEVDSYIQIPGSPDQEQPQFMDRSHNRNLQQSKEDLGSLIQALL